MLYLDLWCLQDSFFMRQKWFEDGRGTKFYFYLLLVLKRDSYPWHLAKGNLVCYLLDFKQMNKIPWFVHQKFSFSEITDSPFESFFKIHADTHPACEISLTHLQKRVSKFCLRASRERTRLQRSQRALGSVLFFSRLFLLLG